MDASDAAAVLARAQQGDGEAFRALVERHSRRAFQLAFRMTRNEQDAEDVVQESFLRAYRQLGRFEARANFATWLHRIVANCAVDVMRTRHARQQRVSDPLDEAAPIQAGTPDPQRLAESREVQDRVDEALGALTPAGAGGLRAQAPRGAFHRGDRTHARPRHQRVEARGIPSREEATPRAALIWKRLNR